MFRPSWAILKQFDAELQAEAPNVYKYDNVKMKYTLISDKS
jgi:hypothetical protein